jgi:hypothetical protein
MSVLQIREALAFLRALPTLAANGEVDPVQLSALSLEDLTEVAANLGHRFAAEDLQEAFQFMMRARLVALGTTKR